MRHLSLQMMGTYSNPTYIQQRKNYNGKNCTKEDYRKHTSTFMDGLESARVEMFSGIIYNLLVYGVRAVDVGVD